MRNEHSGRDLVRRSLDVVEIWGDLFLADLTICLRHAFWHDWGFDREEIDGFPLDQSLDRRPSPRQFVVFPQHQRSGLEKAFHPRESLVGYFWHGLDSSRIHVLGSMSK